MGIHEEGKSDDKLPGGSVGTRKMDFTFDVKTENCSPPPTNTATTALEKKKSEYNERKKMEVWSATVQGGRKKEGATYRKERRRATDNGGVRDWEGVTRNCEG